MRATGTCGQESYDGLPAALHSFRDEPAFSRDSVTFCLWWEAQRPGWRVGVREFLTGHDPDGSEEQLAIYDGDPDTYVSWASGYYEKEVNRDAVAAIYAQAPLTADLFRLLNPEAQIDAVLEEGANWPYADGLGLRGP